METWVIATTVTALVVAGSLGVVLPTALKQHQINEQQVQLSNPIKHVFTQYTTEMYESSLTGHGGFTRQVVFEPFSWYAESGFKDGVSYSYMFQNGYQGFHGTCGRVGDHNNCYVTDDGMSGRISVNKDLFWGTLVDCPPIRDPLTPSKKRQLDKCYYTYKSLDNRGSYEELWYETETFFPVKRIFLNVTSDLKEKWEITEYCSFETEVPSDKTKLSPMKGVTVYDFRKGKEGVFNENEENNLRTTVSNDDFEMAHIQFHEFNSMAGPSMGPSPVHLMSTRDVIPMFFDARENWPKCSVIKQITDQQFCGSCWAMASSAVLADRMCIYTNGKVDLALSPQFMVNCFPSQNGCNGGSMVGPWQELMEVGTVPEKCVSFKAEDGICSGSCDDGTTMTKATKAKNFYSPWGKTDKERVEAIQREIMEHGPVTASFWVFEDWEAVPSPWSIYHRSLTAKKTGGHAVRIIGWGTENNEDYWLIANSHGKGFKEGGVFKMRRGINECNIEESVIASEPLLE